MTDRPVDFSHQTNLSRNKQVRVALTIAGTMSLALGVIGIFLPILPTTPFLLLSAGCYARSSIRFYNWLLNNRIFGKYIQNWRRNGKVPVKTKIFAVSMLALTMGSSIAFFIPLVPVKFLVGLIGVFVAIYIVRLP